MKNLFLTLTFGLAVMLMIGCSNDMPMSVAENGVASADGEWSQSQGGAADVVVTYEITLQNLTVPRGGNAAQPFSPPVFGAHTPGYHIFKVGKPASFEIQRIAEVGNGAPMAALLNSSSSVFDVAQGSGLILPGQTGTFEITAKLGFHKLSFAAMLGITNDGFTGIDAVTLPRDGSVTYYLGSYDGGTEENTELAAHLGAFGNPDARVPTNERIRSHPGILGVGDLDPAIYGWEDPVAKLTITVKSAS